MPSGSSDGIPDSVSPDPARPTTAQIERLHCAPDLLDLHVMVPARYPFLLESAGCAGVAARFDILFAFPEETLTLSAGWHLEGPGSQQGQTDFLAALDRWWTTEARERQRVGLPFDGGWFIFLAYELARQMETGLALDADPSWPVAVATRIPAALVRDRQTNSYFAVAEEGRPDLLRAIAADLRRLRSRREMPNPVPAVLTETGDINEDDPQLFLAAVARAKSHIAAGDIYQANISRRWSARLANPTQPWCLYERLRHTNPAPFAGLALLNGSAIISSSPERLVRVRAGRVETRPIAGTRPRKRPGAPDLARRSELIASPKERAEHVMLIDLERNDLGRICRAGSVRVDEMMTVESYAHVHHIVSNVSGELRAGIQPGQVLRAVFPGGTITGCPKVRCMSIIHELESRPRGAYCGAMGYLNRDGSCDFSILIRTMTLQGRELRLDAGSGIVADSSAERELEETRAKAKGMLISLHDRTE